MVKILNVKGRQVFDSRGNPTVEAEVYLDNGISASSIAPSGASTGAFEAFELRDKNQSIFLGKSVFKAIKNINLKISPLLKNKDPIQQKEIDNLIIKLDGTENKSNLGANAILAVSLAIAKTSSILNNKPLYKNLGDSYNLPFL